MFNLDYISNIQNYGGALKSGFHTAVINDYIDRHEDIDISAIVAREKELREIRDRLVRRHDSAQAFHAYHAWKANQHKGYTLKAMAAVC